MADRKRIEQLIENALIREAFRFQQEASANAPIKTGQLRRSIFPPQIFRLGSRSYAIVGADPNVARYVVYQEFGTGEITPKRAKALRWFSEGGKPIFAKRTRGITGKFFLTNAVRAASGRLLAAVRAILSGA